MAYQKKEGDITLNINTESGDNQPTLKGNVYLEGKEFPMVFFRKQNVEGRQPTHYGHVDKNGEQLKFSAWLKGRGPQENRRPNISGKITMGDWERGFAIWEKEGQKGPWFAGNIDFRDEYKKPAYKSDGGGSTTAQSPHQSSSTSGQVSQASDNVSSFDLDDGFDSEIPF